MKKKKKKKKKSKRKEIVKVLHLLVILKVLHLLVILMGVHEIMWGKIYITHKSRSKSSKPYPESRAQLYIFLL